MASPLITTRDALVSQPSIFCTVSGWTNIPDGTQIAINVQNQQGNVALSCFYAPAAIKDYFFDGPVFALYASENDVDYNGIVISGGLENGAAAPGQPTWSAVQNGASITINGQTESGFQGVDFAMAAIMASNTVQQILQDTNVQFLGQMVSRVQTYITSWLSGLVLTPYTPPVAPTLWGTYPPNLYFQSGIEMVDASAFLLTLTPSAGAVTVGKTAVPPA